MSICTKFVNDYDQPWNPCTCPKCKGFLKASFPTDNQFQCRKCGQVLETIPVNPYADEDDIEDDSEDYKYGGKICIVPDYAIKIKVQDFTEIRVNKRKHKTERWAFGVGFSRMVWRLGDREFIEVNGERIEIGDKRIIMISEPKEEVKP